MPLVIFNTEPARTSVTFCDEPIKTGGWLTVTGPDGDEWVRVQYGADDSAKDVANRIRAALFQTSTPHHRP